MGTSHHGTAASDGLFIGPVRRLGSALAKRQVTGDSDSERTALRDAIALSVSDLAGLMERIDGEAQDILGFQVAMLEDDALAAPALACAIR